MQTIRAMVHEYITHGGGARYALVGDDHGVLFTDDGEFIPWSALAYNAALGFFDVRAFPDAVNEAAPLQYTIHPVRADDGWDAVALVGVDGHGFLIGEAWQVEDLYLAIAAYLQRREGGEMLRDDAEVLGHKWLTIDEAVRMAHEFDATEYPVSVSTAERIRRAAQRGKIPYSKTESGRYQFPAARFRGWLHRKDN